MPHPTIDELLRELASPGHEMSAGMSRPEVDRFMKRLEAVLQVAPNYCDDFMAAQRQAEAQRWRRFVQLVERGYADIEAGRLVPKPTVTWH